MHRHIKILKRLFILELGNKPFHWAISEKFQNNSDVLNLKYLARQEAKLKVFLNVNLTIH